MNYLQMTYYFLKKNHLNPVSRTFREHPVALSTFFSFPDASVRFGRRKVLLLSRWQLISLACFPVYQFTKIEMGDIWQRQFANESAAISGYINVSQTTRRARNYVDLFAES